MRLAILKIGPLTPAGATVELFADVEIVAGALVRRAVGWSVAPLATGVIDKTVVEDLAQRHPGWDKFDGNALSVLGGSLYDALLTTDAGKTWLSLRAAAPPQNVRTLFQVEPPEKPTPGALPLADLRTMPWELARDTETEFAVPAFVDSGPCARFVRRAAAATPPPACLRVLVVVGPPDPRQKEIDGGNERRVLLRLFAKRRHDIDARVLVNPTIAQVRDALTPDPTQPEKWLPHAFHFIGHGEAAAANAGSLILGQPTGTEVWTSTQIAQDLRGLPLRCAVLNACGTNGGVANAAVANAFLATGASAVVCMAADVFGAMAAAFAQSFYEHALRGEAVDVAVRGARAAIYGKEVDSADWVIPQLIVSDRDIEARDAGGWSLVSRPVETITSGSVLFDDLERFVDREDARALLGAAIDEPWGAGKLLHISGQAEAGKTTLAKWAFERSLRRSWDARFIDGAKARGLESVEIMRLLRDGHAPDPAVMAYFDEFAFAANHLFRGKRPPDTGPAGAVADDYLTWRTREGAAPPGEWQELLWGAYRAGLQAWSRARRLVLVFESFHLCADVVRAELASRLFDELAAGRLPNVTVVVSSLELQRGEPTLDKAIACRVETAFTAQDARLVLDAYVSLEPFKPDEWDEVDALARAYAEKHIERRAHFRLHQLPAILKAFKVTVRGA